MNISKKKTLLFASLVACSLGIGLPQPARAACETLPSDKGVATLSVSVPTATKYRFWARLYSPSSGKDAVYLQVDESYCKITVGNGGDQNMPIGKYTWVDYRDGTTSSKISLDLSAGKHTIKLSGLDADVRVDKILLLGDMSCVPTGNGTNCAASTSSSPSSSGGSGSTPNSGSAQSGPNSPSVLDPSAADNSATNSGDGSTPDAQNDSENGSNNNSQSSQNLLLRLLPWIIGAIVLVVAAVGFLIWRRRRANNKGDYGDLPPLPPTNVTRGDL